MSWSSLSGLSSSSSSQSSPSSSFIAVYLWSNSSVCFSFFHNNGGSWPLFVLTKQTMAHNTPPYWSVTNVLLYSCTAMLHAALYCILKKHSQHSALLVYHQCIAVGCTAVHCYFTSWFKERQTNCLFKKYTKHMEHSALIGLSLMYCFEI